MAKTLDLTELEIGSKIIFAGQTFKVDSFANMAGKDNFSITIHGIEANEPMEEGIHMEPVVVVPNPVFAPDSPGEGYRFLEVGEKIQEGDEWYEDGNGWETTSAQGARTPRNYCYRRKVEVKEPVKEPVKKYPDMAYINGKLVDPGEGYRLLELGETVNAGDEYHEYGQKWRRTSCAGELIIEKPDNCYRRKL